MRTTDLGGVTNLITHLTDYSVLRHKSRTPRLVIIIIATLRYGSRTPGLVVKDTATAWHGSKMPRWLEGASEREESVAAWLTRDDCWVGAERPRTVCGGRRFVGEIRLRLS
ncbi:hypothetical protein B296_00004573 [Ensete ventricosum]|uniref:Uncharacterized protein n=1 Tax=Ensete ventricosum TaxID=4639 RepID=A0A427AIT7_ENSVE|nr:hypothetical protein B296_00004573 [Ensete ventricosum]